MPGKIWGRYVSIWGMDVSVVHLGKHDDALPISVPATENTPRVPDGFECWVPFRSGTFLRLKVSNKGRRVKYSVGTSDGSLRPVSQRDTSLQSAVQEFFRVHGLTPTFVTDALDLGSVEFNAEMRRVYRRKVVEGLPAEDRRAFGYHIPDEVWKQIDHHNASYHGGVRCVS